MHLPSRNYTLLLLPLLVAVGCRGEISNQPPIHIVPNMDFQAKLKAQSESKFANWTDGRGMRLPVKGTIARGALGPLSTDPQLAKLHVFKDTAGNYVDNPLPATAAVLARGRQRFEINCAVCHGRAGRLGIVGRRLAVKPPILVKPSTEEDKSTRVDKWPDMQKYKDGRFFEIISNGSGTMQPYRYQVTVEDRWAIVHYIRALQYRAEH
ncbi:MAG: cytochrome c [Planctomycetes bacterium]|nr:cytochrome c [Planctomycetota bacterium]MCB9870285.1 cytochrome c [Planctomycetota bacterium]MCB9888135.1 cytochrome c [Planctomycetota bacterium]